MSDSSTPRNTKSQKVTLSGEGIESELPLHKGTLGPDVIDIRALYKKTDTFTYDSGFTSTASCESKITFIDGEKGILLHRGYSIEELAENGDYLEVCYLILNGELPTQNELNDFKINISNHITLDKKIAHFFEGFNRDAHPMGVMCSIVGALSTYYHESIDINNKKDRMLSAYKLIAKMPTIASMAYKFSMNQPFIQPDNKLDFVSNFLNMMFSKDGEEFKQNDVFSSAIEKIFILHADHEQNASTSTVRLAGSSGANPFACIAAGIGSLWGPAHGGANEAVLKMLNEIGSVEKIKFFLEKAKDKNDPFRLMGFGHRVYKNYDPRAAALKASAHDVLNALGIQNEPLLKLAVELESIALKDDYFNERKLFPNVDFYSGIILKAMGFPTSMFTVLFAIARTVGWISHWNEMIDEPNYKIGRPRQLYTGPTERQYVKLSNR